jgi:hypothetical protein
VRYITEPARQIPVASEVDILVAGAGPAGVCAALAAARAGKRVLLTEQMGALGGMAVTGGHPHIGTFRSSGTGSYWIVGGIGKEICDRLVKAGSGFYNGSLFDYEVEAMKRLLDQLMVDHNISVLHHTFACGAIVNGNAVEGIFIQNKGGRQAVLSRITIDCTGDADIAASAGAPFEKGRAEDGRMQPATTMFRIAGVDTARVRAFQREKGWQLYDVWKEAIANGDMDPFQTQVMGFWCCPTRPDRIWVNFTNIRDVDATDPVSITQAEVEGRRQAHVALRVMRKYIPGCENAYITDTADYLGIRESRRIRGLATLTVEDVLTVRKQPEQCIAKGSAFVDIHHPVDTGLHNPRYLPDDSHYDIPYGCIVPIGVENLLVAGRCISVTHEAAGSARWMAQCMALGHAAGEAAAMALDEGVKLSELNVGKLRQRLLAAGAVV